MLSPPNKQQYSFISALQVHISSIVRWGMGSLKILDACPVGMCWVSISRQNIS